MASVPRPLIALLLGTVAFFALWTVALKPGSSTSGGSGGSQGLGAYQSAIHKAHQAVATSNSASVAHGGTVATTTAPAPPLSKAASASQTGEKAAASPKAPAHRSASVAGNREQRLDLVERALAAREVVAVVFYNPSGADDRAVAQELAAVPVHRGLVKLAVPVTELSSYPEITNQVSITSSPTLVLIDRNQQASELVGFADRFEIAQRVADGLTA